MATADHSNQPQPSLTHRLTYFLSTALTSFDLDSVYHDLVVTVAEHLYLWCAGVVCVTVMVAMRYLRDSRLPPGPWAWPVVGHLTYLMNNPHFRLSHLREVYGEVYQLRCGGRRVVVLGSLEAVLQGLVEQTSDFSGRPQFSSYRALYKSSQQQGVCTSDVSERYYIKKQFISAAVDAYCSCASRIEDKLSSEIVDTLGQFTELETPFDPAPLLQMACLNVALNLTFSQRFDPSGRVAKEILRTFECRSSVFALHAVDFLPVLKAFTTDDHHDYIQQLSNRQMHSYKRLLNVHKDSYNPDSLRDFTDQLLLFMERREDSDLLLKEDIDNLLLDMAGYGFQDIAVTLTWLLGYMALNPEVQSEVHGELDSVVGRDRLPCLEDQPYLTLTEAVMCEVQRLATVRPFLIPHRSTKRTSILGYEIPDDTVVLFNIWGIHHDPRYWPNPTRFDPYRFLNEDKTLDIPDHFLPYGAGTRQCPGESLAEVEIFLFFATFMHQLQVLPGSPSMTLEGVFDHLLRPKPFQIVVQERD